MRLERTTLSARRVGVAAGGSAMVLVAVLVAATAPWGGAGSGPLAVAAPASESASPGRARVLAARPQPAPAPRITAAPGTQPTQESAPPEEVEGAGGTGVVIGDGASEGHDAPTGPIGEADIAAAKQVAADFSSEYISYRFDEPADAVVARVRPYVTDAFAASIARSSGAGTARGELVEREEVSVGSVQAIHTDTVSAEMLRLLVVARQELVWRDGEETRYPTLLLRLAPTADGWRVDAVES